MLRRMVSLALADARHESLLTACAVLSLAAMLTPLLVLFGVRHGIVNTLQERLRSDPRTVELIPQGSRAYAPEWFTELAARPESAFVLPQTRSIAAVIRLRPVQGALEGAGRSVDVSLIATAPGDPLLARSGTPTPAADDLAGLALSASAAQKLNLKPGDALEGVIDRRRDGKDESGLLKLSIVGVLPLEFQSKDAAYVSLPLLSMLEEYRDGFAVPALDLPGNDPADRPGLQDRPYPTFRLYAKDLESVEPLRQYLLSKGVESMTKAEEIEQVHSLNRAFTLVFALIAGAAFFGFLGAASGNALASVRRKSRSFGLLRLRGFSRRALMLFPVVQSLLVGVLGTALAAGFYAATAYGIDALFASRFAAGGAVCVLLPEHFAAAFGLTACFSVLASLAAAGTCAKIEPSEVIRDV